MGTPNTTHRPAEDVGEASTGVAATAVMVAGRDRLADIDSIIDVLRRRDEKSAGQATEITDRRRAFLDQFHRACDDQIKPAMESVVDRLRLKDGDGLIEVHPGGEPRVATPRLTLWMSLQGKIAGSPRQDRNPYLQIDADVANETIRLTEGDSWQDHSGGHSGTAGTWQLDEITQALVVDEVLAVLRRAAGISAETGAP